MQANELMNGHDWRKSSGFERSMSPDSTQAGLNVQLGADDTLRVEMTGDWLAASGLPSIEPIENSLASGGVKAMEFDTKRLGRWDSGIMASLIRNLELCEDKQIEFRGDTLSPGLTKLIGLARAVPEKKDAA